MRTFSRKFSTLGKRMKGILWLLFLLLLLLVCCFGDFAFLFVMICSKLFFTSAFGGLLCGFCFKYKKKENKNRREGRKNESNAEAASGP